MSTITISLSDERLERLKEMAESAGLTPEEFIRASLEEWLAGENEEFAAAARHVLEKNAELYRRLA
ncbi:MAG: ribbon-helix-helix protein, CopG family [Planctomycetia bacterium]|nr:ribbon-helix-helix protein, CopG family [Planctomycetia bacterium]